MAHTIRIFVIDGALSYIHHNGNDPSNDEPGTHLFLPPGEKVRFVSRDGDYSIVFDTGSPFESGDLSLSGLQNKATKYETILDPGGSGPNPSFKYTAKVGRVTDDPDIIIDNSGGGGPKPKLKSKSKLKK
jgi:hypothetical protein